MKNELCRENDGPHSSVCSADCDAPANPFRPSIEDSIRSILNAWPSFPNAGQRAIPRNCGDVTRQSGADGSGPKPRLPRAKRAEEGGEGRRAGRREGGREGGGGRKSPANFNSRCLRCQHPIDEKDKEEEEEEIKGGRGAAGRRAAGGGG